jgi:hypothetical protein
MRRFTIATPLPMPFFDAATASRFARIALANVEQAYPNKLDHVLTGDGDALPPRTLHPAFYGSYDWHSSVHMHWLLVRARRLHPALPERNAIDAILDRHFDAAALLRERAYLQRPEARAQARAATPSRTCAQTSALRAARDRRIRPRRWRR